MGLFEDLNRSGLLAIGQSPQWTDQALTLTAGDSGPPASASAGVYLEGSPRALAYVAARENAAYRTSRVQITTTDLVATTYTVTIDGTAVAYDASAETPADLAALVAGIAAAIEADGTVGLVVNATTDPDNADSVLITGIGQSTYSIQGSVSGGSGAIAITADADGFDVRAWVTPAGTIKTGSTGNASRWVSPPDYVFSGQDSAGWVHPFAVGGLDRMALQVSGVVGHGSDGAAGVAVTQTIAGAMIGPSVL